MSLAQESWSLQARPSIRSLTRGGAQAGRQAVATAAPSRLCHQRAPQDLQPGPWQVRPSVRRSPQCLLTGELRGPEGVAAGACAAQAGTSVDPEAPTDGNPVGDGKRLGHLTWVPRDLLGQKLCRRVQG